MKAKAMYFGKRRVDLPARVNNYGTQLDAWKGYNLTFFQNTWYEDELKEKGCYFKQFVPDDAEMPKLEVGKIYTINITDLKENQCEVCTEEESPDLPF